MLSAVRWLGPGRLRRVAGTRPFSNASAAVAVTSTEVGGANALSVSPAAEARAALSQLVASATAVRAHPPVQRLLEPIVSSGGSDALVLRRVSLLGPQELALLALRCSSLGLRHEQLLEETAWSVVQALPPEGACQDAVTAHSESLAVALPTILRVLVEAGLTNDRHLIATGLGRAIELIPYMHTQSIGELMVVVSKFDRLAFSYAEALDQTHRATSGKGRVVGTAPDGSPILHEPFVDGSPAVNTDEKVNSSATTGESTTVLAAAAAEEAVAEDTCVVHPNLIDVLMDTCEERLKHLCDEGNAINARIEGSAVANVDTDSAMAQRRAEGQAQDGISRDQEVSEGVFLTTSASGDGHAVAKPIHKHGPSHRLLPRAVVITPASIRSILQGFATVGLRDISVMEGLARQLKAFLDHYCAMAAHRRLPDLLPGLRHGRDPLAATQLPPAAAATDDGPWMIGPLTVDDIIGTLMAAGAVVPRVTDVLEPEARGATTMDARVDRIRPLLEVLAPLLLKLPFDYIARTTPSLIVDLRKTCERIPHVATACPALWDQIRLAKVQRRKLPNAGEGASPPRGARIIPNRGVGEVRGERRLGELGKRKYEQQLRWEQRARTLKHAPSSQLPRDRQIHYDHFKCFDGRPARNRRKAPPTKIKLSKVGSKIQKHFGSKFKRTNQ